MLKSTELIHTLAMHVRARDGDFYEVRVYGAELEDHSWEGWLEFIPVSGEGPVLRTKVETSQHDRETLDYWAGGLELIYSQGALARAVALDDTSRRSATTQKTKQTDAQDSRPQP